MKQENTNRGVREADLRWDACVLSRLHTGAWNVRFLWLRRMAMVYKGARGIEIRRSFMRTRQWSTD